MKILFYTLYFPPECGAAQTRTHELTARLAEMGHEISVLTAFPNYPDGKIPPEWRGHLFWRGREKNIELMRVWCYTASNRSYVRRIISHIWFAVSACLALPMLPKVDVIVVESHPLFNGIAGLFLSWAKRVPYVMIVSDLWPEGAVQMGVLKNRLIIRVLKEMEIAFYRSSAAILAMTRYIKQKITEDGIDASKITLFRNCVDCEFFRPALDGHGIRPQLGLAPDDFVVAYAGTFGRLNNVSAILEAAAIFQQQDPSRVRFVFAGDGAYRQDLMALAAARKLENVKFIGTIPKERIPHLLNAADCVVISLIDRPLLHGTLPRKMFEAMACGKPIVAAAIGEARDMVAESGAGICVQPENPRAIYDAIVELSKSPESMVGMGLNGRAYVSAHFSHQARATELTQVAEFILQRAA